MKTENPFRKLNRAADEIIRNANRAFEFWADDDLVDALFIMEEIERDANTAAQWAAELAEVLRGEIVDYCQKAPARSSSDGPCQKK